MGRRGKEIEEYSVGHEMLRHAIRLKQRIHRQWFACESWVYTLACEGLAGS